VSTTSTMDPPADLLVGLRDGAWLDAQDFPPLRYAVPGVLPEGSVLLVGPPKIGKSWFVLSAGLAIATGGQMLGIRIGEPRPVLLLALEDGDRRLQDRCRKLLAGEPIPKGLQYMTRIQPGRLLDTLASWLEVFGGDAPLVVLDTLGKVMPPAQLGESSYQRDYRIGSAIKRLADEYPGVTLLVNHHDRKAASEDFVDAVSGTHGLAGAADTIVVLARPRTEEDGVLKVTGRDVPEAEYAVRFVGGCGWELDGRSLTEAAANAAASRATTNLGDDSARVVKFVAEQGPVRAAPVAQLLGVDVKRAGTYLGRLADSGRIVRLERGLYGPVPPP
jgi:AAA domain-containing protein/putative AbiEi antitoxin of type IV toxin-antitoxin system